MSLSAKTLHDLKGFLLSDCVTVKGTQVGHLTALVIAIEVEEKAQQTQQALASRVAVQPPAKLPET